MGDIRADRYTGGGAAVGGTLLEGRQEATPLCPGLGPDWPECDGLS